MSEKLNEIEPFGSASISKTGSMDLRSLFTSEEMLSTGISAMLLGHDPDNADRGEAFSVGAKGTHKGHGITVGRTRGGKGVSSIVPALLTYAGSMVVIDPKGENAWITAQRRRDMGQRVVILDPWNEVNKRYGSKVGVTEEITKFNPLAAIDPDDSDFADDITALAEAFILQTGNDPHWPDSARELTGGLIAAKVQQNPGMASMREVRKLLRAPLKELTAAVESVMDEYPDSVAASKLAAVVEKDEEGKSVSTREMGSIRSTARTQTGFLDSARLLESMETEDNAFDLRDLATGKVTLYLVLPVDRLKSHGRWLRMILTLAIRAISKADEIPAVPVLFILDELGTISPGSGLSMIEQSYGLMAGLGIRIWAFLQDLPQLQRDYPNSWETFISNSSVIQLLNVADNTTARYFSEYLGNGTINAKTGSFTFKQVRWKPGEWERLVQNLGATYKAKGLNRQPIPGRGGDISYVDKSPEFEAIKDLKAMGRTEDGNMVWEPDTQLMSRPVMFPWEIVDADETKSIIIMPGVKNCQLQRFVYFSDPFLSKLARPNPTKPVYQAPQAAQSAPPPPPPPPPPRV